MSDSNVDPETGTGTTTSAVTASRPVATPEPSSSNIHLNGDASNSSQINASSIHQSSSAGNGSLPRQYPGRTYYFSRARAPSSSAGTQAAMSLTQSHFDIREGSARLASLGLAEEFEDEEGLESEDRGEDISGKPFFSQSWANDGQDAFARRPSAIRGLSDSPEALHLSKTPVVSGQNTPSGLSALLAKHEGIKASSSSSTLKPEPTSTASSSKTAAVQPFGGVIEEESPVASGSSTPQTSSEGSVTVGHKTPEASSSAILASPLTSSPIDMKAKKRNSIDVLKESLKEDQKHFPHNVSPPKRKSTLEATVDQATLGLPASYNERSPLLRKGQDHKVRRASGAQSDMSDAFGPSPHSTTDTTHYVGNGHAAYGAGLAARWTRFFDNIKNKMVHGAKEQAESASLLRKKSPSDLAVTLFVEPLKTIPAVVLGILMNLLDGVSYGMIMFPVSSPVFATFGGIGVSMFFASCFVSQLVYSSRSIFRGGNGSMMIEVVPFLHVIAFSISDRLGGVENAHAVIATTMVAYALTSILTGLAFFLLGYLRLGAFIEFFPRVVLVGCIGGVGAFLLITGVEVCAGLENEHLEFSFELIKRFFEVKLFVLWFIPLVLAAVIRIVTSSRFDHPLVFPAFFLFIPIVFYIIVFAAHIPIDTLRENGWIFQLQGVNTPWYEYFKMFDFKATDFGAVLQTMPTQFALVFFALLHVPINVPALALSVGEDNVDTNTELVNHGLSNFISGCFGTIPNYLVYTNSVLFYRVGGTTRLSSFMLALATLAVFLIGPWVIGYLPVMIVGTLIYILGYDLLKEAVWDTYGRVSGFDYTTIWIIVAAMTYFDFVIGIGVGIVAACVSFVIVSSQRQPIRAIMSGATASSTVRRHPRQSNFLRRVGSQTRIIKLQSFLFFGTVVKVEATIRELLDAASWEANPIRYLILDFSLASGVDFSAAEAFLRIQRLLLVREVVLVLCGCDLDTPVGKSLRNIELFRDSPEEQVRVFSNLNDALESCENSQLRSLYSKTLEPTITHQQQDMTRLGIDSPYRLAAQERPADLEAFSPRRAHLLHAAKETLVGKKTSAEPSSIFSSAPPSTTTPVKAQKAQWPEPVRLLMQALGPYAPELKEDFFNRLVPYFRKIKVAKGEILWQINDQADSFYVLETGILKAVYNFPNQLMDVAQGKPGDELSYHHAISESMLPGTIAGEMTFLAGIKRNTTVSAERDCILWKMDTKDLKAMEENERPGIARSFRQCVLRASAESADVLFGHLISG